MVFEWGGGRRVLSEMQEYSYALSRSLVEDIWATNLVLPWQLYRYSGILPIAILHEDLRAEGLSSAK